MLATFSSNIIALTETRLNKTVHDSEVFPPGWSVVRTDRSGRDGGGVLLAARTPFVLRQLNCGAASGDEIVCVLVSKGSLRFICCVVYLPPRIPDSRYYSIFNCVDSMLQNFDLPLIVVGDFNLYSTSASVRNDFDMFLSSTNMLQVSNVINNIGHILDLVLTSEAMSEVSVTEAETSLVSLEGHHPPLDISIGITKFRQKLHSQPKSDTSPRDRNFRKSDIFNLYLKLSEIDWTALYSLPCVNTAVDYLYSAINNVVNEVVPFMNPKIPSKYPEWFSPETLTLNKLKNEYHKLFKQTKNQFYYALFYYYRKMVIKKSNSDLVNFCKKVQSSIKHNPSAFWAFVKRNKISYQPATFESMTKQEVADTFARFFKSVFLPNQPHLDVEACVAAANEVHFAPIRHVDVSEVSEGDIRQAIKRLSPKFTQGPDGLPQFMIKDCREVFISPLCYLFNLSIKTKTYPKQWKISKVIPVHKTGSKSDIRNYRPIAVLSIFAKIFETVLYSAIFKQLRGWFCDEQHGFLPNRSTTSNLLNITTIIGSNLDQKTQVDVAYLDFRKAFDRVNNDQLLKKMALAGFASTLLSFFRAYFLDRNQYVEYEKFKSAPYAVTSGIGQGSSLGPLLFLLLINDLPNSVKSSLCLIFADDVKLALPVKCKDDSNLLQTDIDNVSAWSQDNSLELNVTKCSVLTYSRRDPTLYTYRLGDAPLNRVQSVRDLGVTFDTQLKFNDHVVAICKSARKSLGFIKRQSKFFDQREVICNLYNAFVRSRLESNSAVWNPHSNVYVTMVERVQKSFVRFLYKKLYGYYPYMYPTQFILGMVAQRTLEIRRKLSLLKYLFNLIRGYHSNPALLRQVPFYIPPVLQQNLRPRRHPLFAVDLPRTEALKQTPFFEGLSLINTIQKNNQTDIFSSSEQKFLTAAGHYLEQTTARSSVVALPRTAPASSGRLLRS